MSRSKDRFVTGCQQVLALGAVLAVLTPAARVLTLDVVHEAPGGAPAYGLGLGQSNGVSVTGRLSAYAAETVNTSVVPAEVVDPVVTEYALTAPADGRVAKRALQARTRVAGGAAEVVAEPQPVTGYGAVGVTWQHGEAIDDDAISFEVRTETDGAWTGWAELAYHDEHGPDPDSAEARRARPGTDELLVGEVDRVQVRVRSKAGVPDDLRLAVVDPGHAGVVAREKPALHATGGGATDEPADELTSGAGDAESGTDGLALRAATYTPRPVIYSRAQWGANEKLRGKSAPSYYEVHAGFVHHTVNANDYTRAQVPGILRSIYAYHTQSRGWSDVGYNFLVDRFGRIWEGRAGGIDRPVVGAHTLGYNENSFAMSAIGNFDVAQPSSAMVQAYGALFAWKLSLHGVDASSPSQVVGKKSFRAINGHRDAGSTACPGRHLYAKVPQIRDLAAGAQEGWSGRERESDLVGTPHPDLLVRNATDGKGYIVPTGGLTAFRAARPVAAGWGAADASGTAVVSPDLTGDGRPDLVVRRADGSAQVRAADGSGGFAATGPATAATADHDLLTAVGDLDGDGRNDLVARAATGRLDVYRGNGAGGFTRQAGTAGWEGYDVLVGPGDLDGDGRADLLARDTAGKLWLHRGSAGLDPATRQAIAGSWKQFGSITGGGDYDRDGRADLFVQRADNGNGFVRPGRGDGTFGSAIGPVKRTGALTAVTSGGDLVGDATPDLVARRGDALVVVENVGTFDTTAPVPTGVNLRNADVLLSVGDWDRDGAGDMVTRNRSTGALSLRRGDGTGRFGKATQLAKGFRDVQLLAAAGDLTGDGWPDLVGQPVGGALRVYPGRGLDGLAASYVIRSRVAATQQVPVGRWDADGAPDTLFRVGDRLSLYPGNGPGGLTTPRALGTDVSAYDWLVGVSDVQLTGHADVIARSKADGKLWLLPGTTSGLGARRLIGEGAGVYDLVG
ncbi:FG-GAP-like repeat-containing protein [Nocardioides abyssi]|uniref:FG-GAP-like repeat-containing protein n=1 Tax=Nocardioides abyssi TaxID=3058370 RepID=A0ABT8EVT1_9ACTN|nr:FG-GAP-like repeat-containing protein [Nocardioides abyssi]MDN4162280.1 FG-GAP-like repeat-containing protein [Nocardioides abyssi]